MPDDSNNIFDDDNLVPDWLQGMDDDSSDAPGEDDFFDDLPLPDADQLSQEQPATPPPAGSEPPPWERHAAEASPPPASPTPADAPWEAASGPPAPPPQPSAASAPWGAGAPPTLPPPGMAAEPSTPEDSGAADAFEAPAEPEPGDADEIPELPRGLTGALPWMAEPEQPATPEEPQFTFDDLADEFEQEPDDAPAPAEPEQPPSLRDRLLAMSPDRDDEPPPSAPDTDTGDAMAAEDADWMSAFGDAGETDLPSDADVPASDEADMAWLEDDEDDAGAGEPPAPEPEPEDEDDLAFLLDEDADLPAPDFDELGVDDEDFSFDDLPMPEYGAEKPEEPDPVARDEGEFLPDWLDEAEPPPEDKFDAAPQAEPAEELPDWLGQAAEDEFDEPAAEEPEPVAEDEGEFLPDWLDEADAPTTGIRRIRPVDEAEEEAPAEAPPGWLDEGERAEEVAPSDIPPGMTYDEWEQSQIEREQEEQKTPEERLLEEVPDWFERLDQDAPAPEAPETPEAEAPAQPAQPEFVPDWFLGLDEQDEEEAPDWFKQIDYSAEPVMSAEEPDEEAAAPEPADVPDWFAGADAGAGQDVDWAEMFGGPSEPAEPGEMPDWLAASAPGEDEMAEPGDIPFPDLDLDQEMPAPEEGEQEKAAEETPPEDWMADFVPTEPGALAKTGQLSESGEDFVERFEPVDPTQMEPAQPAPDDEAPDWLREMGDEEAEELPLPDDLLGAPEPSEPAEPEPSLAEGEPDWLSDLSPEDLEAPQEPVDLEAGVEAEAEPEEEPEPELDSGAIDDLLGWGSDLPAVQEEPETAIAPMDDLESLFDEAAFREELQTEEGAAAEPEPEPEPEPGVEALELDLEDFELPVEGELQPDWVQEMRPEDLPVTFSIGGVEISRRQRSLDELPERLQDFRQAAQDEQEKVASQAGAPPEAGTLKGMSGVLPVLSSVLPYDAADMAVEGLVVSDAQRRRADQLQGMLNLLAEEEEEELADEEDEFEDAARLLFEEEEGEVVPEEDAASPRRRRQARFKPDRLVVTLLLLVALIAPFATDALHLADDPPALAGARREAAQAVAALAPDELVLVAFEYSPTAAGELDPLAEAVLRDVLAQRAVPLTISTNPAGALHAEAVLERLAEDDALLDTRRYIETGWRRFTPRASIRPAYAAGTPGSVALEGVTRLANTGSMVIARRAWQAERTLRQANLGPGAADVLAGRAALALLDEGTRWLQQDNREDRLRPGEDYFVLRYLSGDAVGVRSLREDDEDDGKVHPAFDTDLRGEQTGLAVTSLEDDIALLVVIGEQSDDVRVWAEQLNGVPLPKIALVTAAIEPLVVPYASDGAYMGYLAGYRDAYVYNAARNAGTRTIYTVPEGIDYDVPHPEESRWHSMALGAALAAALITLGAGFNLLRVFIRRRSRR
jgi:hypothetical protein